MGLWGVITLWQSFLNERLQELWGAQTRELQTLVRTYYDLYPDITMPKAAKTKDLPPVLQAQVMEVQARYRDDALTFDPSGADMAKLLQTQSHRQRLGLFRATLTKESKRLAARLSLKGIGCDAPPARSRQLHAADAHARNSRRDEAEDVAEDFAEDDSAEDSAEDSTPTEGRRFLSTHTEKGHSSASSFRLLDTPLERIMEPACTAGVTLAEGSPQRRMILLRRDRSDAQVEAEGWASAARRQIGCWLAALPTPTQSQLSGCMGALALHIGSRLDAAWRAAQTVGAPLSSGISGGISGVTAEPGCEWLEDRSAIGWPQLPTLPAAEGSFMQHVLPIIPRLLPSAAEMQMLSRNPGELKLGSSPAMGSSPSMSSSPAMTNNRGIDNRGIDNSPSQLSNGAMPSEEGVLDVTHAQQGPSAAHSLAVGAAAGFGLATVVAVAGTARGALRAYFRPALRQTYPAIQTKGAAPPLVSA